jgi:hypothetical protein
MVWLCWVLRAAAAPVELPPDAPPEAWSNPLALAGLHAGTVGEGAGARISAAPSGWWLWVRGEDGAEHVLRVQPPSTRAEREALAALVASLVHPVSLPEVSLPDLPPVADVATLVPPPRTVPAAPRSVDASPSLPQATPTPAAPSAPMGDPVGLSPIRALASSLGPAALAGPPEPDYKWRWWAGIGPSLRVRPAVRSVAAAGVWVGVAGRAGVPLRLGVGLEGAAPGALTELEADSRMGSVDLRGAAVWAPPSRDDRGGWELGPAAAVSVRVLTYAGAAQVGPGSSVGVVVARRVAVGPGAVRVALMVERDVLRSVVHDEDGSEDRLQPLSASLGVGLWTR